MDIFIKLAREFGIPYAIAIAEGLVIWKMLQHERDNTVPKSIFDENEKQHHTEVVGLFKSLGAAMEQVILSQKQIETILAERKKD